MIGVRTGAFLEGVAVDVVPPRPVDKRMAAAAGEYDYTCVGTMLVHLLNR